MKIAERFRHSAAVCWVTTYTFEPAFFEAFLLRRLGEPPLPRGISIVSPPARR